MRGVSLLGSTGSIGESALDVLARHPQRYRVLALSGNTRVDALFEQCRRYRPAYAAMYDAASAARLAERVRATGLGIEVLSGPEGLAHIASLPQADIVLAGMVGAVGLLPTLAAVRAGKRVLFANKEPLVMSGHIFMREARASGAELLPIDSEHNAIFQCLPHDYRSGDAAAGVRKVVLTCSGGPFRNARPEELTDVTPAQACEHPRWRMGRKISVDSATLMNKGLELIEACRLFDLRPDQVEIVIHPQSVIHSMVEYADGSVLAQLSNPDMRTPIAHALAWPERIDAGVASLDLVEIGRLDFERPDDRRFPCLRLARAAAEAGGTAPAILNAANEAAVAAFLAGEIGFTAIPPVIEHCMATVAARADAELAAVLADDGRARDCARDYILRHAARTGGR
ncbi:MAG: 1-deoxy-D-xylulose-5-phosphate reductoisomerase [Gammaproteobacteria bacterium]|nr:1-deoxy-D-xylulose-5-phosphate reductoisomerase [Gammaproteobacteria bacterium]